MVGNGRQRGRLAVRNGQHRGPLLPRKLHGPHRPPGVARETDADDHVALPHPEQLLKELTGGRGMHHHHIVKNQIEIEAQKAGNGGGGADTHNIDPSGGHNGVHRGGERLPVGLLHGQADFLHIRLHHHGENIVVTDTVIGHLNPLDAGELVADHLL